MRRPSTLGLVILATLFCLGHARVAAQSEPPSAITADEEARLLFEAGRAAFSAGRYDEALARFERAHELSGRPELLYNLAVSADRMRQDERALETFRAYLAAMPEAPQRAEIEGRVAILEREIEARRRAASPPVDLRVAAPGPPPPDLGPAPRADDGTAEALAITGGVIAGLGVLGAVTFGALALAEDQALAQSCSPSCAPGSSDGLASLSIATDASLGLALAGATLLVVDLAIDLGQGDGGPGGRDDARVLLAPSADGVQLAMHGRLP